VKGHKIVLAVTMGVIFTEKKMFNFIVTVETLFNIKTREDDSYGVLRHVASYKSTDISEVLTAFIIALMLEAVRISESQFLPGYMAQCPTRQSSPYSSL
jgi:hypothetical protein